MTEEAARALQTFRARKQIATSGESLNSGSLPRRRERDSAAEIRAERYFENLQRFFFEAEKTCGKTEDFFLSLAGYAVRLRFAGSALQPAILPAFEHIRIEAVSEPELTVCLFDWASAGLEVPLSPAGEWQTARREIPGYDQDEAIRGFFPRDGGIHVLDARRKLGIFAFPDAACVPQSERGAPLARIFRWWARSRGLQLLHAGAVAVGSGGVLLAGKGGAGKSTTAVSCLGQGLLYASDDYCLVNTAAPYSAFSIYSSAKIHSEKVGSFPFLLPPRSLPPAETSLEQSPHERKTLFFVQNYFPQQIIRETAVRAIFIPLPYHRPETQLISAAPAYALRELAPSTLFQMPGSQQSDFYDISRLVQELPCFVLKIGSDPATIPPVIEAYLSVS
jgi:hypothetical protein